MTRKATAATVNRVRRAVMGEIDRRSAAAGQLFAPRHRDSYRSGLGDLAGWLEGADVDELLDDRAHPPRKKAGR